MPMGHTFTTTNFQETLVGSLMQLMSLYLGVSVLGRYKVMSRKHTSLGTNPSGWGDTDLRKQAA